MSSVSDRTNDSRDESSTYLKGRHAAEKQEDRRVRYVVELE